MSTDLSEPPQAAVRARRPASPRRAILSLCVGLSVGLNGARVAFGIEEARPVVHPAQPVPGATPPGITLAPSLQSTPRFETDPTSGRLTVDGGRIGFLIQHAYEVHPNDIVYEFDLDRAARYDVIAIPPDGRVATAKAMMRDALEATFGFSATRARRLVAVQVLQRIDGVSPLEESTSPKKTITRRKGRFSGTRITMNDLARFTREIRPYPVIDETGLDGAYDLVMEWDPSGRGNTWVQAYGDLGLRLAIGKRQVEQLVISGTEAGPEPRSDD